MRNMVNIPQWNIEIPPAVKQILQELRRHGCEACVVGGCVRDVLLGREPKDWDITTSALPQEVKKIFPHTVDTGIRHGTVMVLKGGSGYEVTTYRIDGEYHDGRHPDSVTFTRSLEEDLKRRDFTINAFAWGDEGLIDLFGGLTDLANGVIRCVGDPDQRFREDALRIMRAVRFSAQLGFEIEPKTGQMIRQHGPRLQDISKERIRTEWEKTLLSDHCSYVNLYREYGLAPYIICTGADRCFRQEDEPLLEEVHLRRGRFAEDLYKILMITAFFLGLSAKEADTVLRDLRYDNKTRIAVTRILEHQEEPLKADRIRIKQSLNRMGKETWILLLELKDAQMRVRLHDGGVTQENSGTDSLQRVIALTGDILKSDEAYSISQLALDGRDLIRAGYGPGKIIGEMLEKILQKVIQSPTLNKRDVLCNSEFLEEVEHDCKRGV